MRRSIKTAITVGILLISFFDQSLPGIPLLGYVDEGLALLGLLFFLTGKRAYRDRGSVQLMLLTCLLILWGLLCNALYRIQPHPMAIVEDVISSFKFLFLYLGLAEFLRRVGLNTRVVLRLVLLPVKLFMGALFLLACANLLRNIGMSTEIRYGIRGFSFVYPSAGHVINQCADFLLLLTAENELLGRKNTAWKAAALFTMAATLKTRALVLAAVYLALFYFFVAKKRQRLGLEIGLIGLLTALIGYSNFETYFLASERAPRAMFVRGAAKLARQYFPMGTGFGTFGSSAAGHYYSRLYYILGFSTRWGMTPDNPLFINDNYFPTIFAEFGLLMGTVFCVLLYLYFRNILRDEKHSRSPRVRLATWFFAANVLLSSIQSSFLASYTVVYFSVFYFLFFYPNRFEREAKR